MSRRDQDDTRGGIVIHPPTDEAEPEAEGVELVTILVAP